VSTIILPYVLPIALYRMILTRQPEDVDNEEEQSSSEPYVHQYYTKLTSRMPQPNASTTTTTSTTKSVNLAAPVFVPKTTAGTFTPRVNSPDPSSIAASGVRADAPEWPQLNTSQGLSNVSVCPPPFPLYPFFPLFLWSTFAPLET